MDNPTVLPPGMERLYGWFLELCHTDRIYAEGAVALPLSSLAIWAWCQLKGIALQPWELRAIRLLDTLWLTTSRKKPTDAHSDT